MVVVRILLMILLATVATASGQEQRCDDLGSACYCSEPLNFNADPLGSSPLDPPDTDGGKECTIGLQSNSDHEDTIKTVTGTSEGLPGVGYVVRYLEVESGKYNATQQTGLANKTWCARHYAKWSSNFPNPCTGCVQATPPDTRVKIGRNIGGYPNLELQIEWPPSGSGDNRMDFSCKGGGDYNKCTSSQYTGTETTFSDCKGNWCRIEWCLDHSTATETMSVRGRVTVLDENLTAVQEETTRRDFNDYYSTFQTGTTTNPMSSRLQHQPFTGDEDGAYSLRSHIMVALTGVDTSFWIGPADEIEKPDNHTLIDCNLWPGSADCDLTGE